MGLAQYLTWFFVPLPQVMEHTDVSAHSVQLPLTEIYFVQHVIMSRMKHLPGGTHCPLLHNISCSEIPAQSVPLPCGAGLAQNLTCPLVPFPHVTEQGLASVQSVQSPSTENMRC